VVVHPPQVIAVEWRERAVQREDLQSVPGKLEVPDDLGPEQADHIGGHAEPEPGEDLLGHRSSAQHVPALQDERLQAGSRQVGRGDQAVVAAPDDDGVVRLGHRFISVAIPHGRS
jgi:hypothetical protein